MSISSYKTEVEPGVFKTFYLVIAEGINKYTRQRIQMKRRGVVSEPKAQRLYRELWSLCREQRPDIPSIKNWMELKLFYFEHIRSKVRTPENPLGFNPKAVESKISRFHHLKHWDGLHLDLITPIFVKDELDGLEEKEIASRSLSSEIQKELRCVFSFAKDSGLLSVNPLDGLKKRKVPKRKKAALNHGEVERLLFEAKRCKHPYFPIWLLSVTLGLRRSELAGLKWIDIDFETRLAHIRRQKIPGEGIVNFPKDKEERTVAIPKYVMPFLKEFKLRSESEFVIDVDCKAWQGGHQASVLRYFCKEIGIKEVTHHQLRATHITLALIDGVPLGIVKENVGHSKLSTTDGYFVSSGIQMMGQTDGLKVRVPNFKEADVLPLVGVAK